MRDAIHIALCMAAVDDSCAHLRTGYNQLVPTDFPKVKVGQTVYESRRTFSKSLQLKETHTCVFRSQSMWNLLLDYSCVCGHSKRGTKYNSQLVTQLQIRWEIIYKETSEPYNPVSHTAPRTNGVKLFSPSTLHTTYTT